MKKIFFLIFFIALKNIPIFGQTTSINVQIIDIFDDQKDFLFDGYKTDKKPIMYIGPYNTDSLGNFIIENLQFGKYYFRIYYGAGKVYETDTMTIQSPNFQFKFVVPVCKFANTSKICPVCNKNDKIHKIAPTIVDHFFNRKRDERRFNRKNKRRGYMIYDNNLVWVDKKLRNDFDDPCKKWFCERDKIIF